MTEQLLSEDFTSSTEPEFFPPEQEVQEWISKETAEARLLIDRDYPFSAEIIQYKAWIKNDQSAILHEKSNRSPYSFRLPESGAEIVVNERILTGRREKLAEYREGDINTQFKKISQIGRFYIAML